MIYLVLSISPLRCSAAPPYSTSRPHALGISQEASCQSRIPSTARRASSPRPGPETSPRRSWMPTGGTTSRIPTSGPFENARRSAPVQNPVHGRAALHPRAPNGPPGGEWRVGRRRSWLNIPFNSECRASIRSSRRISASIPFSRTRRPRSHGSSRELPNVLGVACASAQVAPYGAAASFVHSM